MFRPVAALLGTLGTGMCIRWECSDCSEWSLTKSEHAPTGERRPCSDRSECEKEDRLVSTSILQNGTIDAKDAHSIPMTGDANIFREVRRLKLQKAAVGERVNNHAVIEASAHFGLKSLGEDQVFRRPIFRSSPESGAVHYDLIFTPVNNLKPAGASRFDEFSNLADCRFLITRAHGAAVGNPRF